MIFMLKLKFKFERLYFQSFKLDISNKEKYQVQLDTVKSADG